MSIERSAGILLPISSLPSNYGIGTLGKEAYRFIDFLKEAGQKYWQILPIGPTSYGDSPYQSFSSFAGNPYFIDLDILIEEGLLKKEDVSGLTVSDPQFVDYEYIYNTRFDVLKKAYRRGKKTRTKEFKAFLKENSDWIGDYALFMAIKNHYDNVSWIEWPRKAMRLRDKETLARFRQKHASQIEFYEFMQYLFFEQYEKMRAYAHENGVKIIGDIPIYVSLDSSDVWADPKTFQLDENGYPTEVAGVPPDYFSEDGQLWGNPLYNWDHLKKTGYKFWINRIAAAAKCYDVIRIDHFRGFQQYWAVPYGDKTARNGRWVDGPSYTFVKVIREWFNDVDFIAEDLGVISEDVNELLRKSGFPGMRVLEFGMDPKGPSYHTPHNHVPNCVCYISTHDNSPIMGWKDNADKGDVKTARKYLGLNPKEGFNFGFIRAGMSSVANLFVCQMQDYLGLGEDCRTNSPGTIGLNWKWRLLDGQADDKLKNKIREMTRLYGRL